MLSDSKVSYPSVIYIGGYGRSGSTLLDILLGSHPEIESCGEIVHFLAEMEQQDSRCSCGASTENCPRWKICFDNVMDELDRSHLSLKEAQSVQQKHESRPSLVKRFFGLRVVNSDIKNYARVQKSLLRSILNDSGARYVVDSSKTASWMSGRPTALNLSGGCSVHFIHLVRKPESVVGSLLKGDNIEMEKGLIDVRHYRVIKGLLGWVQANMVAFATCRLLGKDRHILVRYEDMIYQVQETLGRLADFLGVSFEPWKDVVCGKPVEKTWHIFSGNRMRHSKVKLLPQADQDQIPLLYRFLCLILCWPFKRKFGY